MDFLLIRMKEKLLKKERYEGNIKSIFTGETERLYDSVKPTIKQTTLDDTRNGFVGSSTFLLPKERLYDDVRATKKQTTNFEYNGNAGSYIFQDLWLLINFKDTDLNPNKEIIAQGRSPTTENTKLANGMDILMLILRKLKVIILVPELIILIKFTTKYHKTILANIHKKKIHLIMLN